MTFVRFKSIIAVASCFCLFTLFSITMFLGLSAQTKGGRLKESLTIKTSAGDRIFSVEIADEDKEREIGLMFRKTMPQEYGMLFIYPDPIEITMWMRNTYIPLDMIFIQPDGTISHIAKNTEPFSEKIISSVKPAKAVLEVNAGIVEQAKIQIGDKVMHKAFTAP